MYLYLAPEVLEGKPYNKSVDVFAFSLVLLEIVLSNAGWVKKHISKLSYMQGIRPYITAELNDLYPELVAIITEGWDHDPALRPEFLTIEPRVAALEPSDRGSPGSFDSTLESDHHH